MQKTFEILSKKYNLKQNQIRLISALANRELTVRELIKETKIPIGSVYDQLEELVEMKLVKVKKKPYKVFYIDDFDQVLADFADEQINKQANLRDELLKSITQSRQKIEAYEDYLEFKLGCIKHDSCPSKVYGLLSNFQFPRFMFPENKKKYLKFKENIKRLIGFKFSENEELRNSINIKKYEELENSCKDFRWIINKNEFCRFIQLVKKFGVSEFTELKNRIKAAKSRGVKIKITDTKQDQFIITNNSVQLQVRDYPLFIGLIIMDKKTISYYERIFMSTWNKSQELTIK